MKEALFLVFCGMVVCFSVVHDGEAEEIYTVPDNIVRLIEEGKFDEARAMLKDFRRESPGNPLAIFYLAQLEKDSNKAMALYKEVEILADSSLAARAVVARAEMSFIGINLTNAGELYQRVITDYPTTSSCTEAHYRMGVIRLVNGFPGEAEIHFERCLEKNPDQYLSIMAFAGIMECHVDRKEWEAAIESARRVLEADYDNTITPRVLEVIALSWRELGNNDNSVHYTERLLKHFPESYQAHAIRARGSSIAGNTVFSNDFDNALTDSLAPFFEESETGDSTGEPVVPADTESAEFTVQASAFADKNNAMKLYRRLKEANFKTRLSMKTIADKHFYLVQVDYFKTREEAEKMADRVTEFTGIKSNIIKLK